MEDSFRDIDMMSLTAGEKENTVHKKGQVLNFLATAFGLCFDHLYDSCQSEGNIRDFRIIRIDSLKNTRSFRSQGQMKRYVLGAT